MHNLYFNNFQTRCFTVTVPIVSEFVNGLIGQILRHGDIFGNFETVRSAVVECDLEVDAPWSPLIVAKYHKPMHVSKQT